MSASSLSNTGSPRPTGTRDAIRLMRAPIESPIDRIDGDVRSIGGLVDVLELVDRHGEAVADEHERLAPLLDAAEVGREPLERARADLPADRLDVPWPPQVLLLHRPRRRVVAAASLELADRLQHRLAVAREVDIGHRVERIVDGDEIGRRQLAHEREQRLDDRELLHPLYVVVVEKDRVEADVVTGRFALFVVVGTDGRQSRVAVDLGAEEADALQGDARAVVEHLEVVGGQLENRLAFCVRDDGVDLDERGAAAEDRWLLLRRGALRLLTRIGARHRAGYQRRRQDPAHRRDDNIGRGVDCDNATH